MYIPGFNQYLINEFTGGSPEYVGIPDLGMGGSPEAMGIPDLGMGAFSPPQQFNPIQPTQPMGVLPPAAQPFQQVQAPMPAPAPMPAAAPMPAPAEDYEYLNPFDGDAYEYNAPSARDYDPFAEFREKYGTAPPVAGAAPSYIEGGALLFRNRNGAISGFAAPIEGATYALVDNKTGNVISSGTGQAGLEQVWQASQDRSATMGKNANWSVVGVDPTSGNPFNVASDTPPRSFLGTLADFALPAAGAALLPMVGGPLAGALGTGLGAAGGSAASSIAQGRGLEDTLLRAGITGVTAGGLSAASGTPLLGATPPPTAPVAPTVSSGLSKVASSLGSAASSPTSNAVGNIVVTGASSALAPAVASGLSGVGGSTLGNLASMPAGRGADFADQVFEQPTTPAVSPPQGALPGNEIVVSRPTPAAPTPTVPLVPPLAPSAPAPMPERVSVPEPEIVVSRPTPSAPTTPAVNPGWVLDNGFWRSTSAPSPFEPAPMPEPEIVVSRPTPAAPTPTVPLVPPLAPSAPAPMPERVSVPEPEIVVSRPTPREPTAPTVPLVPPLAPPAPAPMPEPEIVVSRPTPREPEPTTPVVPPVSPAAPTTPKDIQDAFDEEFGDPEAKKRITTEEILKYLRAAGLLSAVIGGGGGGRGSLGTIPGGLGSGFSSVFSGSLPRATLPGAATGFAPRTADELRPQTTQDWYRYGYGPEQSFFDYVPQGEENKSKAFTGYYEGGDVSGPTGGLGMTSESFAVNGPGTGRSDEIPALLSDGEYVIDAETVALLGDGSSKAGAERLDQFRINLRRDKGRKLAKGDFSVNAKRPEQYMKGGRA